MGDTGAVIAHRRLVDSWLGPSVRQLLRSSTKHLSCESLTVSATATARGAATPVARGFARRPSAWCEYAEDVFQRMDGYLPGIRFSRVPPFPAPRASGARASSAPLVGGDNQLDGCWGASKGFG